jgi:hypothetical protein
MPKSHRIRTQVGVDKSIKVNLEQDFESINILSLKILQSDVYNRRCSDYGVVVGRVFVNGGFGLPNARISVFIPLSDEDSSNPVITDIYPYTSIADVDEEGYRYNLLPKEPSYDGHIATGTFPTRKEVLLDQSYIEVYDKYYKYTTRTNDSGDYMIFGVPLGTQTIFLDVDLSDMGCFSLTPQDLIQAGVANETQVNGSKFKSSTNLNELPQIKTLNKIIDIAPLWGEPEICQLGITRVDFDLTSEANISIEPKAVFMGSIISTNDDDAIRVSCKPKNNTGNLCELVAGPGQILAIRQTINIDDLGRPTLEEYRLEQDGKVIDGDGSYLVNLPMNLDYIYTNEFGEQAISDDPKIGIPTKAKYRFKFKWNNEGGLQNEIQRANFFVPNIKEHGWSSSNYTSDPLKVATTPVPLANFTVQPLVLTNGFVIPSGGDLINPILTNVDSFQVAISPTLSPLLPQPYLGNPLNGITGLSANNYIIVTIVPTDPTLPSSIFYTGINGAPNTLFSIPGGPISTTITFPSGGGLVFDEGINTSSYSVNINSTPYYGDTQIIPINPGDQVEVIPNFIDPNQQAEVIYKYYQQDYFDLLRSYSFSLDWDDYVDEQSAINCEDTFYEFHYNKVYTTAMFLDRYKNGIGRAKHLGIKEIDNRTCKSTVNTFPVNDIVRNFDWIFFIFNLFITILTIPFLLILFIAHLVALTWPLLKFVLIYLATRGVIDAGIAVWNATQTAIQTINTQAGIISANLGGPVLNLGNLLESIRLIFDSITQLGYSFLALAFSAILLAVAVIAAFRVTGFPRFGLPMLSYPDCSTCDCDCGNAELADDFDQSTLQGQADSIASDLSGDNGVPSGVPTSATTSTSFLAPMNLVSTFDVTHPNLEQPSTNNGLVVTDGLYYCVTNDQYKSLTYSISEQDIDVNVAVSASLGYQRLISGSESLDTGNDQQGIPDKKLLHAPQPFLFAADRNRDLFNNPTDSQRWLSYPITESYTQKLNEFNYRQKYFDGVNQIKTVFNTPSNFGSLGHLDQPLVILAKPGTLAQIGVGNLFSFQDPSLSFCNQNLTGATFYNSITANTVNQFGNNALTGTTSASTVIQVAYADPTNNNTNAAPTSYLLTGNTGNETYLKFVTDIEYFQVITGFTYSQFILNSNYSPSTNNYFPKKYLNHDARFIFENSCDPYNNTNYLYGQIPDVITKSNDYSGYEILILTRGVDPHSGKYKNKYDLSKLFGQASFGSVIVEGDYYLNVPIQGYSGGNKPKSHNIPTNISQDLYFPTFNFNLSPSYIDQNGFVRNEYTAFTSNLPYYYLCTDDNTVSTVNTYTPWPSFPTVSTLSSGTFYQVNNGAQRNYLLPTIIPSPSTTDSTLDYYFAGGSFTSSNVNSIPYTFWEQWSDQNDTDLYIDPNSSLRKYVVYSTAYHKHSLTPINYPDPNLLPTQYLVMRSDRIPTSTKTQENDGQTSYGLHQNDNFTFYTQGTTSNPTISFAPDQNGGQTVYDETQFVQSLTSTLNCDQMVSLQCYTGSGTNIGVDPNCDVKPDRVKQGCYCLLNYVENENPLTNWLFKKIYLIPEYQNDSRLLLEWITRFRLTFAACRGVFSQTFQNNWINGTLYMFSFNKSTTFTLQQPDEPIYNYCEDVIIFNEITKGFYYRSSPWDGNSFIGVDSPPVNTSLPPYLVNVYPGYGYNTQRIQFPTTVMDLGPRDKFISQICNSDQFNGYIADQVRATSYSDNSDLLQMGFISRMLNASVRNQMLPVSISATGGASEGKSIIQFFNSTRQGDRIDGDFAQALSINSEWRVTPYIEENYPNNYLFIGEDSTSEQRPVFGVFFSSSTEEYQYRRRLSPGVETYPSSCGIDVVSYFGYSSDQEVPHYKWQITGPTPNIFGTENNNWLTTANQNQTGNGFYTNYYQNLDFEDTNEYYLTNTANFGFITNFDNNNQPLSGTTGIVTGIPNGKAVLVGAPFFFYFGLNNGKTAIDKFIKLYVDTAVQ